MIYPTGYVLTCETKGCVAERHHDNQFTLRRDAEKAGWQFGVKLNGQRAQRGGKDYCPQHRKGPGQ